MAKKWQMPVGLVLSAVLLAASACGGGDDDRSGGAVASPSPTPGCTAPTVWPPVATPTPVSPAPVSPSSGPGTTAPRPTTTKPGTTAPGPGVPARLAGKDWEVIPTSRKVVALTFDGGSGSAGVSSILATLRREGIKATFFLTGDFVRGCGGSAQAIAAAGHRIGDHSIDHPYFTKLSDAEIGRQLSTAAGLIKSATGKDPRPLFRFPYGDRDSRTIRTVNRNGYVPVRWTVDTLGWKGTSGGQSAATVVSRVLGALRPGAIVLMHVGAHPTDHSTLDATALPGLISALRDRGYGFVTLDTLVG